MPPIGSPPLPPELSPRSVVPLLSLSPPAPNGCGAVVPITPWVTKPVAPKLGEPPDDDWVVEVLFNVAEVADDVVPPDSPLVPPLLLRLVFSSWESEMVRSSQATHGTANANPTSPRTRRIGASIAPGPVPVPPAFGEKACGIPAFSSVPDPGWIGYYPEHGPMSTSAQARRAGLRIVTDADARGDAAASFGSPALPVSTTAPAPLSDERLIEAVESGDHRLAGELYDRLIGVVDHTLYRVFGRREPDHEDLVQAAFEQIVLTLSRQSFARACSLKTWASTVTSHVGFNALRSRRRERAVLDRQSEAEPESAASAADIERQAVARAELERMREQLVAMKSEHAQTVFLHDVLGHELAEIALMTDVSVAAAQSRLVRGRKELYRRMGVENSGRRRK